MDHVRHTPGLVDEAAQADFLAFPDKILRKEASLPVGLSNDAFHLARLCELPNKQLVV